jgi:hypothetical protein
LVSYRIFGVREKARPSLHIDSLIAKQGHSDVGIFHKIKNKWPVTGAIHFDRDEVFEIGEKGRAYKVVSPSGSCRLFDLDFNWNAGDLVGVSISSNQASWFNGEDPEMPEGLKETASVVGVKWKSREESDHK